MTIGKKTLTTTFILALILSVSFAACGEEEKKQTTQTQSREEGLSLEVNAQDFSNSYHADKKVAILDVRTPGEYEQFHIPGAKLIPVQDIMGKGESIVSEIPFQKDQQIYVICASGNRSYTATRILRSLGYSKSQSVRGGHRAWMSLGNKCETDYLVCK